MSLSVDLNSDMGEGFGPWPMGADDELLGLVTSANIACGFHAGDPDVMDATMRQALRRGVGIGAHPGFADLQGFGRRRIEMPRESLANAVRYQVAAAAGMARAAGGRLRHVKLHGALANMAAEDEGLARVCYEAALSVVPGLVLVTIAATAQERAARALGAAHAAEIFADRGYADDATLLDRRLPGAVFRDPAEAAARVVAMLRDGAIHAASGRRIPARIDTVCLHSDTPGAVAIARAVRAGLEAAGVRIAAFPGP